jgi:hypothetical protein
MMKSTPDRATIRHARWLSLVCALCAALTLFLTESGALPNWSTILIVQSLCVGVFFAGVSWPFWRMAALLFLAVLLSPRWHFRHHAAQLVDPPAKAAVLLVGWTIACYRKPRKDPTHEKAHWLDIWGA